VQREGSGSPSDSSLSPAKCSLSREGRLKGSEIRKIRWITSGETGHFILLTSSDEGARRVCVTVPKRVGTAVMRNRIRRVVKEFLRLNKHLLSGPKDFRIIVKRRPSSLRLCVLAQELSELVSTGQI